VILGFQDVDFASEHRSLQRHLASVFPNTEIRRHYEEGITLSRPYMIINLVTPSVSRRSQWNGWSLVDYVAAYYASDFADAQVAAEKLAALQWKRNRVQIYDYTNPSTPVAVGTSKLRITEATCQFVPDLDDDQMYNVMCNMTVEGKRSFDKYSGESPISSISLIWNNQP
jgi:hypothetical protein